MLKCLFAACLLINLVTNTQAQIDSLANCSFASRYFSLTDLFYAQIKDKDSTQAFQYIDKIRAEAQKNKDTELALHADYFKLWYYQDGRQPNRVQLPLLANKLLTEVKALKNKPLEVEIYLRLAYYHYQLEKNYAAAFTNYLLAYDLLKNLSVETYPNKSYTLQDIGLAYYAFEDYETALHFLLEAVNTKPAYAYSALQTLNNVGLTYFHLNQYDKAITYLTKCRNMAKGMGIYSWVGIADGNLGQVYQQLGKYEQALPLFQSDIDYAFIDKEYANAAMSQLRMADIHLRQANTNLAASNLDKAMKLLLKSGNYPTAYKHLSYLFRLRARILWLRGKTNEAFVAQDSSDYYQDILKSRLNKLQLTRAHQETAARREAEQTRLVLASEQQLTFQRNGLGMAPSPGRITFILLGRLSTTPRAKSGSTGPVMVSSMWQAASKMQARSLWVPSPALVRAFWPMPPSPTRARFG